MLSRCYHGNQQNSNRYPFYAGVVIQNHLYLQAKQTLIERTTEYLVENCIKEYETKNGVIPIDEEEAYNK